MKKVISFVLILVCSASWTVWAESAYLRSTADKFGRGVENIVTSVAEIPCTTEIEMHKGDRIIRFFTGVTKGSILFLRRAFLGVTEVVTFPVPMDRTLPRVCVDQSSSSQPA